MARKLPPEETRFKPGQSGNPAGRVIPVDIQKLRSLNQVHVAKILNIYLQCEESVLDEALSNPKTSMLEKTVCNIIKTACKEGDFTRLNFLLDRTIGKVREAPQEHVLNFQMMPREKILEEGRKALQVIEAEIVKQTKKLKGPDDGND